MLVDLAGMDDGALLGIVRLLPQASERRAAAGELLVSRHQGLVWSCVRPYLHSPEPVEDLMQVGYVGLLKAISNFDPAICRSLAAYASSFQGPGRCRVSSHQRSASVTPGRTAGPADKAPAPAHRLYLQVKTSNYFPEMSVISDAGAVEPALPSTLVQAWPRLTTRGQVNNRS
jgi:hypothetical protein